MRHISIEQLDECGIARKTLPRRIGRLTGQSDCFDTRRFAQVDDIHGAMVSLQMAAYIITLCLIRNVQQRKRLIQF